MNCQDGEHLQSESEQGVCERQDCFVSLVMPLQESWSDGNAEIIESAAYLLSEHYTDYEIVLVDSGRGKAAEACVEDVLSRIRGVRYLKLATSVRDEALAQVGLENSIGDICVLLWPGVDPLIIISDVVNLVLSGHDVVVGVDKPNTSWLYRRLHAVFHRLIAPAIGYNIAPAATGMRGISRRALNAVLARTRHPYRFFLDISSSGYANVDYSYQQLDGSEASRHISQGLRKLLNISVFNSTLPLRVVNLLGLAGSLLGLLITFYSLLINLVKHDVIEGWTSLTFFMASLFTILFIALFFIGEYIARIVDERNEGAQYDVKFERHSSVMLDTNRWNVLTDPQAATVNRTQTGRDR